MKENETTLKNSQLRYAEYYGMTTTFDELYQKSSEGYQFKKLMKIITSKDNILLAYRNIKRNSGSHTRGMDKLTIRDIEEMNIEDFLKQIKQRFSNYRPRKVRRVEIPKPNGKTRPLGIPSIWDRIIQQCILQVLEPICEAKFNKHSFGFRPNSSAEQAINDCMIRMNISRMKYVVDVDIQGFFDEVHHTKLMRQIWALGIQDKQLLVIIRKMLKAPIVLLDGTLQYPKKGTPQGGILSPLLANINLNEFDWWIYNQWEGHKVDEVKPYYRKSNVRAVKHEYEKLRASTKLKEMYIVRYADDFKIFTNTYNNAEKIFYAVKMWLRDRLKLPISKEKSQITNLLKKSSEFLGFSLKLERKGKRYVCQSHISRKSLEKIRKQLKSQIKEIQRQPTPQKIAIETSKYNSKVIGIHNYYKIATQVNKDLQSIHRETLLMFKNRFDNFSNQGNYTGKNKDIKKYLHSKMTRYFLKSIPILPIGYVQHRYPMGKNRKLNKYTPEGRKCIHQNQKSIHEWQIRWLREHPIVGERGSIEINDNRISLFIAQKGKCSVSDRLLDLDDMDCHHKKLWSLTKDDSYHNLTLVTSTVHRAIHIKDSEKINEILDLLKLNEKQLEKLNKLREMVGNPVIISQEEIYEIPIFEQLTLF